MVAAQHVGYLVDSLRREVFGYCRAGYSAEERLRLDAFHHRCVRRKHEVVLVHAHRVVTLLLQYAHHAERYCVEAHHLAYGVRPVGEQIVYHGLAQYAHLRTRLDVGVCEHFSLTHRELPDFEIVLVHAVDRRRRVVVAVYPLSATVHRGADAFDEVALVLDRAVVVELQRLHRRWVLAHTARTAVGSRTNHYHV